MASVSGVRRGQNRILFPSTVARNIDRRGQIFFRGCFTKINLFTGLYGFHRPEGGETGMETGKRQIIVAGEMWSIPDFDLYGVFRSLRGGVGLPSLANLEARPRPQTPSADPVRPRRRAASHLERYLFISIASAFAFFIAFLI